MFEAELTSKLKRIFDLKKVSFHHVNITPQDCANEMDTIFIEVDSSRNSIKDKKFVSKVTGRLKIFANADKMPFGYFSKKIAEANIDDTKDLFFFDFESSSTMFMNIVERSMSFVFLFNSQYDPNVGTLTSTTIQQVNE